SESGTISYVIRSCDLCCVTRDSQSAYRRDARGSMTKAALRSRVVGDDLASSSPLNPAIQSVWCPWRIRKSSHKRIGLGSPAEAAPCCARPGTGRTDANRSVITNSPPTGVLRSAGVEVPDVGRVGGVRQNNSGGRRIDTALRPVAA